MKIIECPRDAMQGMEPFIPTEDKVRYLNQLLQVGFDTLDAGSFVSPKAIPQMRDTAEVFDQLDLSTTQTKILAIVANTRGAEEACRHPAVTYVGFPLSLSETFQQRNTNKSIPQALDTLNEIQDLCVQSGRTLVTYLSMGFGNPYGDPYDADIVSRFTDILNILQVRIISLADTIGVATPDQISMLFSRLAGDFPGIEFGAHLHSQPASAREKVEAAVRAGCRRFDGALLGFGGCPMAKDELVGNVATEVIIQCLTDLGAPPKLNATALARSLEMAKPVFGRH
ncbi:MAG: hydroxymethylglutaryl-CoA lyase [Cyclobacteriaceae bacterium]|nr:hydroxymethylglutaryl-CoA lyase [Cyclobacteriaceae bacterium]